MTDHRGPIPVPARITMALDRIGAEGPQVDIDLGGTEPMVDQWEAGELVPTRAQVEKLAAYTGFPPEWFYRVVEDREHETSRTFICDRTRRGNNGLTIIESHIDYSGVLHYEVIQEGPPDRRKKRT